MYPISGTFHRRSSQHNDCTATTCRADINGRCAPELVVLEDGHGHTIACKSACTTFCTPEYCCTGDHDKATTCLGRFWKVDYPSQFKHWCPDAYSYAFDDPKSTWACIRNGSHQSAYVVEFCP